MLIISCLGKKKTIVYIKYIFGGKCYYFGLNLGYTSNFYRANCSAYKDVIYRNNFSANCEPNKIFNDSL